MTHPNRVPVSTTGARPSLNTLARLGSFTPVVLENLAEGDVILYSDSAFYVVKKASQAYKGSYITLRELVTNSVRSVRIEPRVRVNRLDLDPLVAGNFDGRWDNWRIQVGDVVAYSGLLPDQPVLAIRHSQGWSRTSPPWTPFADVEIVHDVIEGFAQVVRSNVATLAEGSEAILATGSVVATRALTQSSPSVWVRRSEDCWVGNCRGVILSDQMIRYELGRRTYQRLRLPEDS